MCSLNTVPPLRVLCVIANPVDLPRFDEVRLWQEISTATQPLVVEGTLAIERQKEATESALRRSLSQSSWNALYLIVHGQERPAANYGTIALQSSDGHSRNLTATALAALVKASPSTRFVILQAADEASGAFQVLASALAENGVAVLTAPLLNGRALRVFTAKVCGGLASGISPNALTRELQIALEGDTATANDIRFLGQDGDRPVFALPEPRVAAAAAVSESAATPLVAPAARPLPQQVQPAWHEILQRKRAAGRFDVFLCHNSADKPAVKRVAQQLKEAGILPWLDEWELPPGQPWQPLLEKQIGNIKSAAVFVGAVGIGPWQQQELYGFLNEFAGRRLPVIPVLLPDAPSKPELPIFLRAMTWVDFRSSDPDPRKMLIWGITGERPEDS